METLGHVIDGFAVCLQPHNLAFTFFGVLLGTIVGVLPGIGPSAAIALLLPVTYGIDPTSALIMLCGIYYGTKYGGSTTAILIRTPGEADSIMAAVDGYEMARKGRAGAALAVSAIGSFIAGTFGVVALTIFALPLASLALQFGPAEYFMLFLFAMTAVVSLTGTSKAKGLLSTVFGLMLATVGTDMQSGQARFTLGIPEFLDGIDLVVVMVGMFAIAEILRELAKLHHEDKKPLAISGPLWLTREERRRSWGPIGRGTVLGFIIGVLPGAGGTIAAFLSYAMEKRLSKRPEEFGKGAIEGVAGPESANNSETAGSLVPLLSLGVPGGAATAVLLAAFIMYGVTPGPTLFQQRPDLVWGLIDSMYVGNLVLLILNLPLIALFVRLLMIPSGILFPLIIGVAVVGSYSINGSVLDLYLTLLFGLVGLGFGRFNIPIAPFVLAFVLGNMMEQSFRQAMILSDGSLLTFVGSGVSISLLALTLISLALPFLLSQRKSVLEED